jgi:hypothetical protein
MARSGQSNFYTSNKTLELLSLDSLRQKPIGRSEGRIASFGPGSVTRLGTVFAFLAIVYFGQFFIIQEANIFGCFFHKNRYLILQKCVDLCIYVCKYV